ncbi:MAG: prolyl oligopeptidase family serine peptidase [Cyclobacteriaceae bacterium]
MRKYIFLSIIWVLLSCSEEKKSLEEVKAGFGTFVKETIKLRPIDYTKTPIYNSVKHHPEEYAYLDEVNIYSIGHISDDLFLTGLMVSPKKVGKYPIIVLNRGGNRDLGTLIVATAVNEMAPLAAKGYVVVASNYRGNSRSEGVEQFGGDDVNDINNLIESMAEVEIADTSRVGLLGMSRGGMMNYLVLKNHTNSNIRAVVNIGGITNLNVTIEHHPEIAAVMNELIPDFNKNKMAEIEKRSAIYWSDQLPSNIPILILHGTEDQHVNYSQIPPFVDSLKAHGIPHKLISFKGDNHGLKNNIDLAKERIAEWFEVYLR